MDMTAFKADFSGIQLAMYEDWKTSSVNATWDRTTADIANLKWGLSNAAAQDVAVTLDMYNSRMFPRGCKDADMPEYQFFRL